MAFAQIDGARILEALLQFLLPGGLIGLLGWWSGHRQGSITKAQKFREQALQSEEAEGNRAIREADRVSNEWDSIKVYWTDELRAARLDAQEARKGEEECVFRNRQLWQFSVKLAGKWNIRHPDDLIELPNGEAKI